MYDTDSSKPLTVYRVKEPFLHVVQIYHELIGDISVSVEVDVDDATRPPRVVINVQNQVVGLIDVVDGSGATWNFDLDQVQERFRSQYEWRGQPGPVVASS